MTNFASQKTIRLAAWLGALAVIIGAFGAHGLKPHLDVYQIGIFEKGVQYHFYHALALLVTGVLHTVKPDSRLLLFAGRGFTLGIVLFSGSLYVLACRDLLPFGTGWAGPVTPLGGLCFIGGWVALALAMRKS